MSANKYVPHVHVLPEDDANRQLANGFLLDQSIIGRRIHVLEEAGGWNEVLKRFNSIYAAEMDRTPNRFMVLLIDLDGNVERLKLARKCIPDHLRDRVFILGTLSEPEDLKKDLAMQFEAIGLAIAEDCREGTDKFWAHRLLSHNAEEVNRLREIVSPILFPPS
jgi:hypothetical protein